MRSDLYQSAPDARGSVRQFNDGLVSGHEFQTVLEPDGMNGHWIKVDQELRDDAALSKNGKLRGAR